VSPVKCELGFYIPEHDTLQTLSSPQKGGEFRAVPAVRLKCRILDYSHTMQMLMICSSETSVDYQRYGVTSQNTVLLKLTWQYFS
jgi:hypothetical protein